MRLFTPSVKIYDSEGNIIQEIPIEDGQTTITLPREGYGSKVVDGTTLYFQGWIKNGVVSTVYTPNEEVEVVENDVLIPYYAEDPDYSDFTFTVDSVTGEYVLAGANSSITSATIPALYQGNIVSVVKNNAFFCYDYLQTVEMPQTITKIGDYAFRECMQLTSIEIPDSVTSIGHRAFYECLRLTSVTIGNGVTNIGEWTFAECSKLTSITIPNSVTSIGTRAFWMCSELTTVTIGSGVTSIGDDAFNNCRSLTSITIPDNVTSIGDYAFRLCTDLTSVTIGSGVTSIGDSAFLDCSSLPSINVDIGNQNYCSIDGILFNKNVTTLIQYPAGKTDASYIIPNSVTSIEGDAFSYTGLTSITIPYSVKKIERYAFANCTNLSSVTFENTTGWYATSSSDYTGGSSITVTNASANATNLKSYSGSWYSKYLYRE